MARQASACTAAITAIVERIPIVVPSQPAVSPASGMALYTTTWLVVTTRASSSAGT